MTYANPHFLVETGWLEAHLGDAGLRVIDCRIDMLPAEGHAHGFRFVPAADAWKDAHIPGATFVDFNRDLSDPGHKLQFMLPPAGQFADVMSRHGVGDGTRVVLYDGLMNRWAARLWWMLRAFSFKGQAVLLDGGWRGWKEAGGAASADPCRYPAGHVTATYRPGVFTDKHEVLAGGACVVNALTAAQHRGEPGAGHYGRPGRIAGSSNVGFDQLLDPDTGCLRPLEGLRGAFAAGGVDDDSGRVITYCGGGIAASLDAFALALLGHQDVAVYDGSLMEWTADPSLPMETG